MNDSFRISNDRLQVLEDINKKEIPEPDALALKMLYFRLSPDNISSQATSALKKSITTIKTKMPDYFSESAESITDSLRKMSDKNASLSGDFRKLSKHGRQNVQT